MVVLFFFGRHLHKLLPDMRCMGMHLGQAAIRTQRSLYANNSDVSPLFRMLSKSRFHQFPHHPHGFDAVSKLMDVNWLRLPCCTGARHHRIV